MHAVSEFVKRPDDYVSQTKSENMSAPISGKHEVPKSEIIKYGEFAQATYDAFNNDAFPETYGNCRYKKQTF